MLLKWVVLLEVIIKGTGIIPGIIGIYLPGSSKKKEPTDTQPASGHPVPYPPNTGCNSPTSHSRQR